MPGLDAARIEWMFVLCTLTGVPIARITRSAKNKQLQYRLNRPAEASFQIASDDPMANLVYGPDGFPYLSSGDRVLKAFRKEGDIWTIRFTGVVWMLEDQGTEDSIFTNVVAFDPFHRLGKRLVRAVDLSLGVKQKVVFPLQSLSTTAKAMVDRSISLHGNLGLGIRTNTTGAPISTFAATFQQPWEGDLVYIGPSLVEMTETGEMDVWFQPLDRDDGGLAQMHVYEQMGSVRPNAVFAYDVSNRAATQMNRSLDMENMANDMVFYNFNRTKQATQNNAASKTRFGVSESAEVLTEVNTQEYLNARSVEEQFRRRFPQQLVNLTPRTELPPIAFNDYFIGDTVSAYGSKRIREAFGTQARIHTMTIEIGDDSYEKVPTIGSAPELT